jgi:protease II
MLQGDTNPWRTIGHTKWYDPYAVLENPQSAEFKTAMIQELEIYKVALKPHKDRIPKIEKECTHLLHSALPRSPDAAQETILWHTITIFLQHDDGGRINVWMAENGTIVRIFFDLTMFGTDPDSNRYFTIQDIGDGDQTLQLAVYEWGVHSPQYKIDPTGPNAALKGDYLYYEGVENQLRSNRILRVNAKNGRGLMRVLEEEDKRFNLQIIVPPRQNEIFVKSSNALTQHIYRIDGGKAYTYVSSTGTNGDGSTLLPVSKHMYASNTTLEVHGKTHRLPSGQYILDCVHLTDDSLLVTTIRKGICNLYIFSVSNRSFKQVQAGTEPNNSMLHKYSTKPSVSITYPHTPDAVYEIQDQSLSKVKQLPEPYKIHKSAFGAARAADGTKIPYTFVCGAETPSKLLVIGYGAYGISSKRAYPRRWLLWLSNGYALVEAMPRGGRENGDDWYNSARTALRKQTTFDDTAAVIKAVQKRFGFQKAQTAFYGRSAGGWLAAYIGQKYHNLVGAIYAEVPYLDVLRTTTNPDLPLTQLEYDEFGDPTRRPQEFEALQKLSPVDSATLAPHNPPLFLVRTAAHDSQVFPYEAYKFAAKMRGLGWPIFVGMDTKGGHFVKKTEMMQQFAEDFVLIDNALKPRRKQKTRRSAYARTKLRSQRSRGTWRRRRSSRKHLARHSVSPTVE